MKITTLLLAVPVIIAMYSQSAAAEEKWSETVSLTRADSAELNISEPSGYTISIKIGNDVKTDTVPAVFGVANGVANVNAFYPVTFTAPNGATWTKKFQVKKHSSTDIKVSHSTVVAPAAAAPKEAAVGKRMGTVYNKTGKCSIGGTVKLEFSHPEHGTVTSQVDLKKWQQLDIKAGTYSVRAFFWMNNAWVYQVTRDIKIERDGWELTSSCVKTGFDLLVP